MATPVGPRGPHSAYASLAKLPKRSPPATIGGDPRVEGDTWVGVKPGSYRTPSFQDIEKEAYRLLEAGGTRQNPFRFIRRVAGLLASLNLHAPDKFVWPGMAAFAQNRYIAFLTKAPSFLVSSEVKQRTLDTTEEVFKTGFIPCWIYANYGLDAIKRFQAEGHISEKTAQALERIDSGSIEEGNKALLVDEQKTLQECFYEYDIGMWLEAAMSTFGTASFGLFPKPQNAYALSSDWATMRDLKKRTRWNLNVAYPEFTSEDRRRLMQKLARSGGVQPQQLFS